MPKRGPNTGQLDIALSIIYFSGCTFQIHFQFISNTAPNMEIDVYEQYTSNDIASKSDI